MMKKMRFLPYTIGILSLAGIMLFSILFAAGSLDQKIFNILVLVFSLFWFTSMIIAGMLKK